MSDFYKFYMEMTTTEFSTILNLYLDSGGIGLRGDWTPWILNDAFGF